MKRMLDDLPLGEAFSCGSFALTGEDIVDFATRFDPQPWHLSDALAAPTYFETLCASGVHTQAMAIGLMVRAIGDVDVVAGGSLNQAVFHTPVRPDTAYAVQAVWTEARPSSRNPARGVATIDITVTCPEGRVVMQSGVTYIVGRRVPGG